MNVSVMPTEMFAFVILPISRLDVMNSRTSGCQQFRISINAPRLDPPCSINPVTNEYSAPHETEPDERPLTPFTSECRGRRLLTLIPTPPPRDMISIIWERV